MLSIDRFSVDVSVSGSLRPNTVVTISAAVTGSLPTEDVEIRVLLPEFEAAAANGWRPDLRAPLSKASRALHRERRRIGSRERIVITKTVEFPLPGYYRVAVSAFQRSKEPVVHDGMWVQNTSHREVWLLIGEAGGLLTTSFDPSVLADTVAPEPGIRRYQSRWTHRSQATVDASSTQKPVPTPSLVPLVGGGSPQQERFVFYDSETSLPVPVAGATVSIRTYNLSGAVLSSVTRVTDANGYYTGVCNSNPTNTYTTASPTLSNNDLVISNWAGEFSGGYCDGGPIEHVMATEISWIWTRLNQFIPFSRGVLNASRGRVNVTYDPNLAISFYRASDDRIVIGGNIGNGVKLLSDYGRFTVAHEYGHAIHEKALSGNSTGGNCPQEGHALEGFYNLECALSEGFADFVSATAQNVWDQGIYYLYIVDYTNRSYFTPGADASRQEAAVAALLYDLTDSPGGDGGASESWDYVSGERVAATIRDCRLKTGPVGTFRVRGIDDFVYCAERYIDSAVRSSFFLTRYSPATGITANATASSNWPQAGVRSVWRKNLYGLN